MIDWNWVQLFLHNLIRELLIPINQSFIWFAFVVIFSTELKKQKWNKIAESTFANSDFSYFSSIIFKNITVSLKKATLQNEKQTSNLNFYVQLFWKSGNHLFWCFLSQLHYRNENLNFISNFIFQFIKKTKWHVGYTDLVNYGGELTENISGKKQTFYNSL